MIDGGDRSFVGSPYVVKLNNECPIVRASERSDPLSVHVLSLFKVLFLDGQNSRAAARKPISIVEFGMLVCISRQFRRLGRRLAMICVSLHRLRSGPSSEV